MSESLILVRLLRMYFPRNWEFSSALSKLRNFGGVVVWTPQTPPLGTPLLVIQFCKWIGCYEKRPGVRRVSIFVLIINKSKLSNWLCGTQLGAVTNMQTFFDRNLLPLTWSVKVKPSLYGVLQALRVPRGWGSQTSRQLAHEVGKVVSPMHWLPLPPGNIPCTHFC